MGKLPYVVTTDSDETEGYISSVENFKNKKKNSLKCMRFTSNKKKLKIQNTPELLEKNSSSSCRSSRSARSSRSSSRSSVPNRSKSRSNTMLKQKLRGILKHTERESSEDEDEEPSWYQPQGRCLIGQVPQLPGQKPGRGGGFAFVLKRNVKENSLSKQSSSSARQKRSSDKRLSQKKSF